MSVEVIGHDQVRSALADHQGSFALVGPTGVGRSLIVQEWVGSRVQEPVNFGQLDKAFLPGVVYTVDADRQRIPWERILRPLEEGRVQLAVTAATIPDPVRTRMSVFQVGLLSDFEVSRILQSKHKFLQPRQQIARLLGGSLDSLELAVEAAKSLESLDRVLVSGVFDGSVRFDARPALFTLQAACRAVLLGTDPVLNPAGMARIPWGTAYELLQFSLPSVSDHEARNFLVRTLRKCTRRG